MFQQPWLRTLPASLAQHLSHGRSHEKLILRTRLLCNGLGCISTARKALGESELKAEALCLQGSGRAGAEPLTLGGRAVGSRQPELPAERSTLLSAMLPCQHSRDTSCLCRGVADSKNELVLAVWLYYLIFKGERGEIQMKKGGKKYKAVLRISFPLSASVTPVVLQTRLVLHVLHAGTRPNQCMQSWGHLCCRKTTTPCNWTYHEGHQRSPLDNSWQQLTQMFVLKLHKHFSCSTAAGSFCLEEKQKVLQSRVTAGAEASTPHGAATPCLGCKGSQKQLTKPGFRESAFSWSFWLTP